jgi:hypothetical protein
MSGRGRGRGRGGGRGGRGGGPMSASQQYFMASATEAGIDIRNMQRAGLGGGGSVFPDLELHSSGERRLQPHELDGGSEAMRDEGKNDDNMGGGMMKKISAKRTTSLITKMREMHHSMRTSAFYIRTGEEFPDVDRYIARGRGDDDVVINKATMSSHSADTTTTTTSSSSTSSDVVDVDAWCGKLSTRCLGGRKRTRGEGGGVFVPEELCVDSRRLTGGGEGGTAARRLRKLNLAELAAKIKRDGGTLTDQQRNDIDGEDDDGVGEEGDILEDGEESDGADYAANYYESEGEDSGGSDGEPTF